MTDADAIGAVIQAMVERMVTVKVEAALAARLDGGGPSSGTGRWMTPPRAARELGVPEKRVRNLIRRGAVEARLRNLDPGGAKQRKYEVNVDEVAAALTIGTTTAGAPAGDLPKLAEHIRAKGAGR